MTYVMKVGEELYVEIDAKTKCCAFAISFLLTKLTYRVNAYCRAAQHFASALALFCHDLELALASLARTYFAQMFETVDSGGVAIRKFYLDRVIPNCRGALRRHARLEHGQHETRSNASTGGYTRLFLTLVIAQRARTLFP